MSFPCCSSTATLPCGVMVLSIYHRTPSATGLRRIESTMDNSSQSIFKTGRVRHGEVDSSRIRPEQRSFVRVKRHTAGALVGAGSIRLPLFLWPANEKVRCQVLLHELAFAIVLTKHALSCGILVASPLEPQ